jgi:GNAT superfamily N-acetyltransferase
MGLGPGPVVNGINIRKYSGDFRDVAEFTRRVATAVYGGKMWFPLWDAASLRWQFGADANSLCTVAYDGPKLVGSFLSARHLLRAGRSVYPVGVLSWCAVDPQYRNRPVARQLIEGYRQRQDEERLELSLGIVSGDQTSIAYRFWQQYAKAYPQDFRFLLQFGTWVKILAPRAAARGGIGSWERLRMGAFAPLLQFTPLRPGSQVRRYSAGDFPACARLLEKATASLDWALAWPPDQLATQLDHAASRTLVFDRGGTVRGMANYHCLTMEARVPLRAGLIDLWADDGLNPVERARLLAGVCDDLRRQGVQMVFAMRCAMMPAAAFAMNLFVPFPSRDYVIVMFPRSRDMPLPKTWSLLLR